MVFGPLLAGILLIALPFISNRGERSPNRRPWAIAAVLMIVLMIVDLMGGGREITLVAQFQCPEPLPAVRRGRDQRTGLPWRAIVS